MVYRVVFKMLFPCFLLVAFVCCGQMKEFAQDVYDATEEYPPAPRRIDASPDSTGLILVYAEMLEKGLVWDHDVDLEAVSIIRVDDPEHPIIVSDFSYKMVVFQNLDPGMYLVNSLFGSKEEENDNGDKETIYVEKKIDHLPGASIKIDAGTAAYLGKVTYKNESYLGQQWVMSIDRSAEHEIYAWKELKKRCKESPWEPLIDEKILQAQADSQ